MCVKQTIITANINEEETVLHIYPMLLFCFFSCILFVNCSVHRNLQVSTSFILRTIDWYFSIAIFMHSRNKQRDIWCRCTLSWYFMYIWMNHTFDVLVYCCYDFCFGYIYNSSLANVYIWDILYSHKCCLSWDDPWGAQNTDPCWPVCTLPNSHLLAMAATIL